MAEANRSRHQIMRGIVLRVLAMSCFAVMAALLKLSATRGVSVPEMVFYRNAFGLPIVLGWVLLGPGLPALATRRPGAHLWRSLLGLVAMTLTFQALVLLPLAEASTLNFTAPVLATILSWLVFKEQIGRHRWGAVIVGFIGVLIVLRPGQAHDPIPAIGVAVGLLAALGQSGVTITLRQMQGSERVEATVFWFMTVTALAGAMMLPFFGRAHDSGTLALLLGAAISGTATQLFMTASLGAAPVSAIMPFDYLQFFWAILFGWLLFGTTPTIYTFAGAALIIGAGLYTAVREHRRRAKRARLAGGQSGLIVSA